MGKVKVHRATPSLDMTPMVDLAFLLVTFFMLTTKFAPDEPVQVETPSSVSEILLPDTNIMVITVAKDGRVFFTMDGKYHRAELIASIGERYGIKFSEDEKQTFAILSSFGVPMANLQTYLSAPPEERKKITQVGIPADSAHNELADWIVYARMANPKLRIALKGDSDTSYPTVKQVINTLIDRKVLRFNLITNVESAS